MSTQRIDPSSIIGSDYAGNSATQHNPGAVISSTVGTGQIKEHSTLLLNGREYNIHNRISSSGEAEIFLIDNGARQFVLKYYFSNFKPKQEIINKLGAMNRPDLIVPLEYGDWQDRFWEINEYMEGSTLEALFPLRDINRLRKVVDQVIDALHACHQKGIIHRDIKPSNIFFRDKDRTTIVLGDFGIASNLQVGENYRVTTVARTSTYAAPEMFTNINNLTTLDAKVDYYALGITLLELWLGEDPFRQIPEFNIMRIKSEGRVHMPKDLNDDVQSLIKGLITTEPPNRWGHDEVKRWLRGEPVKVLYHTQEIKYTPYEFDRLQGILVSDPKELAYYMEKDPKKAARQLYSGSIANWIQTASADMYSEVHHVVEFEYPSTTPENTTAGINKAIYILDKDRGYEGVGGDKCYSPLALGDHIEKHFSFYQDELTKTTAKIYLFLEARGYQDRVDKYQKYFKLYPTKKALNLMVLDLQDNKFLTGAESFDNVQQLMSAPPAVLQSLPSLVDDRDSKLSLWLDMTFPGLTRNIEMWRKERDFISVETLHYALNTSGLRFNGEEATTTQEFYTLFAKRLSDFTTAADAPASRALADYWLSKYQNTSFQSFLENFLLNGRAGFQDFLPLYQYGLDHCTDDDSLRLVIVLSDAIKASVSEDPTKFSAITAVTAKALEGYLTRHRQFKVYALENLEDLLKTIQTIREIYPAFADTLIDAMQSRMAADIHDDLSKVSQNSDSFQKYRERLEQLMNSTPLPFKEDSGIRTHWQQEERLIGKRTEQFKSQNEAQKSRDLQLIEEKFKKFGKDVVASNVDFLAKGKLFYRIFLWSVAIMFAYNFIVIQYIKFQFVTLPFALSWSAGLLLVAYFLTRHVANRRPYRGLGYLFDHIHKLWGKILYRPMLRKALKDSNHPLLKDAAAQKQGEIQKAISRSDGKERDQLFEESVRIVFLSDNELVSELAN